jgi:hypothetical protein
MMTEDEAREKWCPHTQVSIATSESTDAHSDNRRSEYGSSIEFESNPVCLGSKCMAWRWARELKVFGADPGLSAEVITDKGFCGLAGQP